MSTQGSPAEVLGSSPHLCGQSLGRQTRVAGGSPGGDAGHGVRAGLREWAAPAAGGVGARGRPVPVASPLESCRHWPREGARAPPAALARETGRWARSAGPLGFDRKTRPSPGPRSLRGAGGRRALPQGRGASWGRRPLWPQPRWGRERGPRSPHARGEGSISWAQRPRRSRRGALSLHEEVPLRRAPELGADPPASWGWSCGSG